MEELAMNFARQYYALYDDRNTRSSLGSYYHAENSFMSLEGIKATGAAEITAALATLPFTKINRHVTRMDVHLLFDGGMLVNVIGWLQTEEDQGKHYGFSQVFVLKPLWGEFHIQNDLLRIVDLF